MFGSEVTIEQVRLLRAETIVGICKASAPLALKLQPEILACLKGEKSKAVLDRLSAAPHVAGT